MTFDVVVSKNPKDAFSPAKSKAAKTIRILSFEHHSSDVVSHHIQKVLNKRKLFPTNMASDLLNIAVSVFVADHLILRNDHGYYNWSRHIRLHVPVVEPNKWENAREILESLLSYLTGDKWEVRFRRRKSHRIASKKKTNLDSVCLFSGGLDSFVGAVDLLESNQRVALVGHHGGGSPDATAQKQLFSIIKSIYRRRTIEFVDFYVQPKKADGFSKLEKTKRSRSLLFISLGIVVADALGKSTPVYVPENGFISINPPLTKTRLGSLSTRTTHPYFISLLQQLLSRLDLDHPIINPYQFQTKGEMIAKCKNQSLIKTSMPMTISCAHPSNRNIRKGLTNPAKHCGYCLPCLIRRAAQHHAGITGDRYFDSNLREASDPSGLTGRDYRAVKLALARFAKSERPDIFQALASGPLPAKHKELTKFAGVYARGIREVKEFLDSRTIR